MIEREALERAIVAYARKQSPAAVQDSHGEARIYYAGLSVAGLADAIEAALASPPAARAEVVAWQFQSVAGEWMDSETPSDRDLEIYPDRFRRLYAHPPAPALPGREAMAEAIHKARFVTREPTPFGEDPTDRAYAFRLADAILALLFDPVTPSAKKIVTTSDGFMVETDADGRVRKVLAGPPSAGANKSDGARIRPLSDIALREDDTPLVVHSDGSCSVRGSSDTLSSAGEAQQNGERAVKAQQIAMRWAAQWSVALDYDSSTALEQIIYGLLLPTPPASVTESGWRDVGRALLWAMDEIDALSNRLCGFGYPQGIPALRSDKQVAKARDGYVNAVHARRLVRGAGISLPIPPQGERADGK